jgi:LysM repeat protein
MQKAGKGDTVYGMAARCGHKHLSIVDVIVELNGLKSANSLMEGQTLEIPWPTPTDDGQGNAATSDSGTPGDTANVEPTLPPNVTWYTVKKGDTAIAVAYKFGTTMSALRDLNPEIQFLQCDFGMPMGGKDCTLRPQLGEGQRVRVPAPAASPTVSATPNGSETPTPTPTATFNAPYSDSPGNNMLYEAGALPALRWVASGQLDPKQVYLVTVTDKITNVVYHGTTRDLAFQVPAEWQPTDGKRHLFEWSVAVASKDEHGTPIPSALSTETRTFSWESR